MPTLTDRPTVGQSPITGRQTIMATTTIPRTPAEITAWRLQRMAAVEHRTTRASRWADDVLTTGETNPEHRGNCGCFECKRDRVETDQ
jgi:hypothetical protein